MGAMAVVADTCFVDLQLRQDGDEDALRVGLTVRLTCPLTQWGQRIISPALVCVWIAYATARQGRSRKRIPIQGYSVCDPGGVVGLPVCRNMELIIDELTERCGAIGDLLGDMVH